VPLAFNEWLWSQIGQCKWAVARDSKNLRANGYDKFFTKKRFILLFAQFEKETRVMGLETLLPLTEPNKDLGEKRRATPSGNGSLGWNGTGRSNMP
jgi:hypothetical protein